MSPARTIPEPRTVIVVQQGRLGYVGFLRAIGRQLGDGAVGETGDDLLALGAPCDAGHLRMEHVAVGSRQQAALGQARHQEVALVGDEGDQAGGARRGVRRQAAQGLSARADLEGGLLGPLARGVDVVHGEAAARLGGDEEKALVGREGELRHAHGHVELGMRGERPRVAVVDPVAGQGLPHRLGRGDVDGVGPGGGHETSLRGDAEERGRGRGGRRPLRGELDARLAGGGEETESLCERRGSGSGRGRGG